MAHTILSTSSAIEDVTAELPMFALTFTAKALPITIGSLSGWLWLAGITARPRATSSRTSSADMPSRAAMKAISAVISPARARCNWVPRSRTSPGRAGRPTARSITAFGSVYGPEVSYKSKSAPVDRCTRRNGTRSVTPSGPATSR
ncbi:hypothetical protein I551_5812 [Mycobacterium ulcerans str. Harvey]|uniref:Uncharacterized protein n=1 Tax=Mycobacterium ulcerans str. Harvey TaxID=1299332 RepID=A0ABP3ADV8_MYCUL|nr:hypothetical protein I551_5812 [Mycobacterium ulcerans str. Harvey]